MNVLISLRNFKSKNIENAETQTIKFNEQEHLETSISKSPSLLIKRIQTNQNTKKILKKDQLLIDLINKRLIHNNKNLANNNNVTNIKEKYFSDIKQIEKGNNKKVISNYDLKDKEVVNSDSVNDDYSFYYEKNISERDKLYKIKLKSIYYNKSLRTENLIKSESEYNYKAKTRSSLLTLDLPKLASSNKIKKSCSKTTIKPNLSMKSEGISNF